MKGLRLYPKWHNYELDRHLLPRAGRRRHRAGNGRLDSASASRTPGSGAGWSTCPTCRWRTVARWSRPVPEARFVLVNGVGFAGSPLGQKDGGLPANYAIEISRLTAVLGNEIGQLGRPLGAGPGGVRHGHALQLPRPRHAENQGARHQRSRQGKNPSRKRRPAVRRIGVAAFWSAAIHRCFPGITRRHRARKSAASECFTRKRASAKDFHDDWSRPWHESIRVVSASPLATPVSLRLAPLRESFSPSALSEKWTSPGGQGHEAFWPVGLFSAATARRL